MRDNLIKKDTLLECLPLFVRLQHYPKTDGAIFISSVTISKRKYIIPIRKRIKKSFLLIGVHCLIYFTEKENGKAQFKCSSVNIYTSKYLF